MRKMSIDLRCADPARGTSGADLIRHALSGAVMGTRWSAVFYARQGFDTAPLFAALAQAVTQVDRQMSTWNPMSDLCRINAAPVGEWIAVPADLAAVLRCGLAIGRASNGAFDIGMGDAVAAWGFGADRADPARIKAALGARAPVYERLELAPVGDHKVDQADDPAADQAGGRVRKHAAVALDLNGIAKGYGVDRLYAVLRGLGRFGRDIPAGLVAIDGELRGFGGHPDGADWAVAVEAPDPDQRRPFAMLGLRDAAVATSGDYRHRIAVSGVTGGGVTGGGGHLSHTMDPARGGPLVASPASVTVIAPTCMEADAWATALMVMGCSLGADFARKAGMNALFLDREGGDIRQTGVGAVFGAGFGDQP